MDSGSELSITDQESLLKMLESDDPESVRLALSIIDKYNRPSIMINRSTKFYGAFAPTDRPIIICSSFQHIVRQTASFELLKTADDWIKENKDMLIRLKKY